jgi:WD40 repeat protein
MKILWPDWACSPPTFAPGRGWLVASTPFEPKVRFYDPGTGREEVACRHASVWDIARTSLHFSPDDRLAVLDHHLLDLGAWWDWVDAPQEDPPQLDPLPTPQFPRTATVLLLQTLPVRVVAGVDSKVQTWNLAENRVEHERTGMFSELTVSPDGAWLAWNRREPGTVALSPRLSSEMIVVKHKNRAYQSAFSPDGRVLATTTVSPSKVHLWEVPGGRSLAVFKAFPSYAEALTFHPSGRLLAAGGGSTQVRFYDLVALKELTGLQMPGRVGGIAFSPDGALMAVTFRDCHGVALVDMDDLLPR